VSSATPLGKKDQVAKTIQSDLSQMGARCELDMNNIVTVSLEDLSPEEQQKFKALQEYMQVQSSISQDLVKKGYLTTHISQIFQEHSLT
jgi:hypothetical protein